MLVISMNTFFKVIVVFKFTNYMNLIICFEFSIKCQFISKIPKIPNYIQKIPIPKNSENFNSDGIFIFRKISDENWMSFNIPKFFGKFPKLLFSIRSIRKSALTSTIGGCTPFAVTLNEISRV